MFRTYEIGHNLFKCDSKVHNFAVAMSPKAYKFYVDGILTATFKSKKGVRDKCSLLFDAE